MSKQQAQAIYRKNVDLTIEMFGYINKQVAIQFTRADLYRAREKRGAIKSKHK